MIGRRCYGGPLISAVQYLSVAKVVARRSDLSRKEKHTHLNGTILWPAANHSLQPWFKGLHVSS